MSDTTGWDFAVYRYVRIVNMLGCPGVDLNLRDGDERPLPYFLSLLRLAMRVF